MIARLFVLSILLCDVLVGQVESSVAGRPGAPFRLGFGASGMAFGNALASTPSLPITGYYNPALVPFQSNPSAELSTGFLTLDRHLYFLSFGRPIKPSGGISLGVISAGVTGIEERDGDGQPTGITSTSENAFLLSFGVKIAPRVAIGISTKILYFKLFTDIHSTTVGFDFGAVYLLSQDFTIGAVVQDVASNYKWDTTKLYGLTGNSTREFFPVRKRLGLGYAPSSVPIVAAVELERVAAATLFRTGVRVELLSEFSLQAGVDQIDFAGGLPAKPSMGFSLKTKVAGWDTMIDYAFVLEPYSPAGFHMLSLGVQFQ